MWGTSPVFLKTTRSGQSTPEYFYAQNDHLGTPQQLIDQAGTIVWAQRAEAFGRTTVVQATVTNNLRFPGQYYGRETDTHYNYFRDYESSTGRYVQKDPISFYGGLNIYAYADGNPLVRFDEEGLQFVIIHRPGGGVENRGLFLGWVLMILSLISLLVQLRRVSQKKRRVTIDRSLVTDMS